LCGGFWAFSLSYSSVGAWSAGDLLWCFHPSPYEEVVLPDYPVLTVCLSLTVLILVFVLLRERRIRAALQQLLSRILSHWRSSPHETTERHSDPARDDPDDGL
jgi:hypothetical protein